MTRWIAGVAVLAWLVGALALGFDWQGHETSPGVWTDGVSLTRWVTCWGLLILLGAGTGRLLQGWTARLLALLPLIAWIAWQLRAGTLGPIPLVIYLVPTILAWCVGLLVGNVVWQRLGGSRYGS